MAGVDTSRLHGACAIDLFDQGQAEVHAVIFMARAAAIQGILLSEGPISKSYLRLADPKTMRGQRALCLSDASPSVVPVRMNPTMSRLELKISLDASGGSLRSE